MSASGQLTFWISILLHFTEIIPASSTFINFSIYWKKLPILWQVLEQRTMFAPLAAGGRRSSLYIAATSPATPPTTMMMMMIIIIITSRCILLHTHTHTIYIYYRLHIHIIMYGFLVQAVCFVSISILGQAQKAWLTYQHLPLLWAPASPWEAWEFLAEGHPNTLLCLMERVISMAIVNPKFIGFKLDYTPSNSQYLKLHPYISLLACTTFLGANIFKFLAPQVLRTCVWPSRPAWRQSCGVKILRISWHEEWKRWKREVHLAKFDSSVFEIHTGNWWSEGVIPSSRWAGNSGLNATVKHQAYSSTLGLGGHVCAK